MSLLTLDPRDSGIREEAPINPRVGVLQGKVVGIRHKPRWTNFRVFGQEVESVLRKDYGVRDVIWVEFDETKGYSVPKEAMDEFANKIDTAIVGLGA